MREKCVVFFAAAVLVLAATPAWSQDQFFIRGDVNADGIVNHNDTTVLNVYLFVGTPMTCHNAGDVNDDGSVDLDDLSHLANFVVHGTPSIPPPYPECGVDPTNPQPGENCCEPPPGVPSLTLMGVLLLVLLLAGTGVLLHRKTRTNVPAH